MHKFLLVIMQQVIRSSVDGAYVSIFWEQLRSLGQYVNSFVEKSHCFVPSQIAFLPGQIEVLITVLWCSVGLTDKCNCISERFVSRYYPKSTTII